MTEPRKVSLFRNGRNKALRIPVEFEPEGNEVMIRKEGNLLIIEPVAIAPKKKTLRDLLASWEPEPDFPDIDDSGLLPLDDIKLE